MTFLQGCILSTAHKWQDCVKKLERWKNYEFCRDPNQVGIMSWGEESRAAFHAERAARQEHRSAVNALSWELEQNKEYY